VPPTTCATAPAGTVVTYTYDLAGRRTGVSDTSAAIQPVATPGSSIQYAASYSYDALNRPSGVSWTPAPTAATPASAASVAFIHNYNAVNQRTSQSVSDNNWISYPAATPATTSYTANSLNQYTAVGAASPTYDGNGNTTSDGTYTLGYDPENRLVSASGGGNAASYAFDGRGRRKLKTVNGTTTISITDAQNREVLEYDGSTGAILRWYAYGLGPNAVLNQMNVAASTRATLLPDQLGSIIGSMDSSTATLTAFAYKPYGSSGAPPAQFGFTGQRFDVESGFYYYRARQYSPGWGRFLQADPIGYQGGTHLYAYATNDPLNLVDPMGLWVLQFGLNVGGALGIAALSYEVGIAIDGHGHLATYDTATVGLGIGVEAGAAASLTVSPTLDNVGQLKGEGVSASVTAGEGIQLTGTYAVSPDGPSYGISLNLGLGSVVSTSAGYTNTNVNCFNCATDAEQVSGNDASTTPAVPLSTSNAGPGIGYFPVGAK